MLLTVLHSKNAIQINIAIMRTFVRLREILATHQDLARKVKEKGITLNMIQKWLGHVQLTTVAIYATR